MKRPFQFLVILVLIVFATVGLTLFLRQNPDPVQLEFIGWRTRAISEGAIVAISFFLGILVTLFFAIAAVISKSIEAARFRRENLALQRMLEDHSNSSKKERFDVSN